MTTELKTMQDLRNLLAEMPPLKAWAALQEWLSPLEKFAFVGKLMSVYTTDMLHNLKAVEAHSINTVASTYIRKALKEVPEFTQDEVAECLELFSKAVEELLRTADKRRQVRVVPSILQAIADFLSACEKDEEAVFVGTALDDIYSELRHLKGVTF